MLGLGIRLCPATPGWAVGVCVCLSARSAGTLPLLVGVRGAGGYAWALAMAAPGHSWLGCWGLGVRALLVPRHSWLGCAVWVRVLGLGSRLRPASPGWGVGVCVCALRWYPVTPGSGVGVCVCALRWYPASSGWDFGVCVCVWARVSAGPRHSWLGGWGVRVRVLTPLVSRHSWLGCAAWVCVLWLGFLLRLATPDWGAGVCVFLCALRLYPATPGRGLWWVGWLMPGTCSCAVVPCVLCALPGFAAPGGRCCLAPARVPWLWPEACLSDMPRAPALVRRASSGLVALGAPVSFSDAVVRCPFPGA